MQHGQGVLYEGDGREVKRGIWMRGKLALRGGVEKGGNFVGENVGGENLS